MIKKALDICATLIFWLVGLSILGIFDDRPIEIWVYITQSLWGANYVLPLLLLLLIIQITLWYEWKTLFVWFSATALRPLGWIYRFIVHILGLKGFRKYISQHIGLFILRLIDHFRLYLLVIPFFVISFVVSIVLLNGYYINIYIVTVIFLSYILIHYYVRLYTIFSSSANTTTIQNISDWLDSNTDLYDKVEGEVDENVNKKYVLFLTYSMNAIQRYVKGLSREKNIIIHFLIQIIYTSVITTVIFFLIYSLLIRTGDVHFNSYQSDPFLFYYSMSHIVNINIGNFQPESTFSITISSIEAILGYSILGILFYGLFNIKMKSWKQDFYRLRKALKPHVKRLKSATISRLDLSPDKLEAILESDLSEALSRMVDSELELADIGKHRLTDEVGEEPAVNSAYAEKYQEGATQFNRGRRSGKKEDFLEAAESFAAAGEIKPYSTAPILNEAYARLQAARLEEGEIAAQKMSEVIPILERYIENEDQPTKNAYTILIQLYRQNNQSEKAIELAEIAIEDLSNRPAHFEMSGTRGVKYAGKIQEESSSRTVEGAAPDQIILSTDSGTVSGSFRKEEGGKRQEKGQLQVALYLHGTEIESSQTSSLSDTLQISADLTGMTPLAELQNQRLNALNETGHTERAIQAYRNQIRRHPENATYRYNYGSLLLNAGQFDEAAEQLQKAIEIDPDDPKKQYNLGAAYLNKGVQIQDSLVDLRDSFLQKEQSPTKEEQQTVKELDQQRRELFKKAIPPLERARELSGRDGDYYQEACQALFQAYIQTDQQKRAENLQEYIDEDWDSDENENSKKPGK